MFRFVIPVIFCLITSPALSQVTISEICTSNGNILYDDTYFNFEGWIEIQNRGNATVRIGGYFLSDDPADPGKWMIPFGTSLSAGGIILIWCDEKNIGYHTNFKLDADGDEILLSAPNLSLVDRIIYPRQYTDVSYGRPNGTPTALGYFAKPTPRTPNSSTVAVELLDNPDFSLRAGRYGTAQTLTITHSLSDVEIRYTVDGTEPNLQSTLYKSPIDISSTRTVKAKAFREGYIPSKTEVKTFFIGQHDFTLPVISISTNPDYLWDEKIGIYTNGTNGIPGNCNGENMNWNQDWERHAVFEYFDTDGSKFFDQQVDIRIGGGCSRNFPQKSFAISPRDKYGKSTIDFDFFSTKNISSYGSFMLRNSGNDFYSTMFRDALLQSLTIGQMDLDYLAYQPTTFYLNGEYWGIQNLREKIDGDYIEANYGISKDQIDLLEFGGNVIEGNNTHYLTYLETLQQMDLSSPEAYNFIREHIDVQEFVNYLVTQIYYANTDWPGNNIKFWRERSAKGRYRWILWDLDFGFALYDWAAATHPTLNFATEVEGPGWPNPPWSTLHIRLLLQNPEFRNKFVQTMATAMSTTFKPARVNKMIDEFSERIRREYGFHAARWGLSVENWNAEILRMRNFATERRNYMQGHLGSFFGLGESVRLSAEAFPAGSGSVTINGITASESIEEGIYYKGLPIEIAPAPAPGYRFSHYVIRKKSVEQIQLIDRGSEWSYFDNGASPGTGWAALSFPDAGWMKGNAQFGYGEGDEQTVVNFGPDPNNKYITTYFRKTFEVTDVAGMEQLIGNVLYDDGVVIYLNGVEVYRGNMPEGEITNSTFAGGITPVEGSFVRFTIPASALLPGINVIAAEVHQANPTSSDVSFDLDLGTFRTGDETETTITSPLYSDVVGSDVEVSAYYETDVVTPGLVINEFTARNSTYEDPFGGKDDWIEVYNGGTETIDLAGYYVTDDAAVKTKHRIKNSGISGETTVAPGQYKILWADEEPGQGALHLPFRLSADGEFIGFYKMEGATLITIDEVAFDEQPQLSSFSRIPDATGPFVTTSAITPLAVNEFQVPTAVEDRGEGHVQVYPNPARTSVMISSRKAIERVNVFSSSGLLVYSTTGIADGAQIDMDYLPQGVYQFVFYIAGKAVSKRVVKL